MIKIASENEKLTETAATAEDAPLRLRLSTIPVEGPDVFDIDSPQSPPSPHLSPFFESSSRSSHHSADDGRSDISSCRFPRDLDRCRQVGQLSHATSSAVQDGVVGVPLRSTSGSSQRSGALAEGSSVAGGGGLRRGLFGKAAG